VLAFVGDHFRIPTVGVAVDPTHIAPDDPAVLALVRANRRALRTIRDEPDLAVRYVNALIPSLQRTCPKMAHSVNIRKPTISSLVEVERKIFDVAGGEPGPLSTSA
jgi:hypothetical protein